MTTVPRGSSTRVQRPLAVASMLTLLWLAMTLRWLSPVLAPLAQSLFVRWYLQLGFASAGAAPTTPGLDLSRTSATNR
jgi:hypothetical protein